MKQSTKARRCKEEKCNRLIRTHNKTGHCTSCRSNARKRELKRKSCFICAEKCCGKMLIEYRKNQIISVCTFHFDWLMNPKFLPMKDLRKEIKRLRGYH